MLWASRFLLHICVVVCTISEIVNAVFGFQKRELGRNLAKIIQMSI